MLTTIALDVAVLDYGTSVQKSRDVLEDGSGT